MTQDTIVIYGFAAFMIFVIGFFGYVAVSMVKQFLTTGSMMRGPKTDEAGGEREDPPGMRGYSHTGGDASNND